jgi:hypothetical protein
MIVTVIGDRWGVTNDEVALHFPCDDWVGTPAMEAWRAVTVHTSADELWPWVTQVRVAPYSYDWIDNLGRRSPQSLRRLDEPTVGENFTCAAGLKLGRILSVTPRRRAHRPDPRCDHLLRVGRATIRGILHAASDEDCHGYELATCAPTLYR